VAIRMSHTEQTRALLKSINKLRIGNGKRKGDLIMLWTIVVVLFALWLLGFSMSVGGGLIHALLVIALIIVVFNLISGRRSSV
jgi:4-hydroxybenzoate polyprenyltransferase